MKSSYEGGNNVIVTAAQVIHESVRSNGENGDVIVHEDEEEAEALKDGPTSLHISGDEFLIVAPIGDSENGENVVESIAARIRIALEKRGIGSYIGAAVHVEGETEIDLIKRADAKMLEDKKERRKKRFSEEDFRKIRLARKALEDGGMTVSWDRFLSALTPHNHAPQLPHSEQ